ncbi:hypothetical protein HT031_003542 [Scenedesmus sp. PABB004]|nr:hypothetical protein HT031_003542 [Scenedesmus sp. PABB004]
MAQLRQLMGVSDDLHKQYMEAIAADPDVCAINGSQPPPPKRQKTGPGGPRGAAPGGKARPRPGRSSDAAYAPPPPTYGLPHRIAPSQDPHGLVGCRVNIIQEDDSVMEGMVVDFTPSTGAHYVLVGLGTPDEAGDALPLLEYPESYQNLGLHPDYVPPAPPAMPASMPPPAARPRTSSYSGAGGSGGGGGARAPKQRKQPTVRGAGGGGGGGGGGGRLGAAPFNPAALDARLVVADLPELANMLAAISRKERAILAEMEAAGLVDEELSRSVMQRDELVRQVPRTAPAAALEPAQRAWPSHHMSVATAHAMSPQSTWMQSALFAPSPAAQAPRSCAAPGDASLAAARHALHAPGGGYGEDQSPRRSSYSVQQHQIAAAAAAAAAVAVQSRRASIDRAMAAARRNSLDVAAAAVAARRASIDAAHAHAAAVARRESMDAAHAHPAFTRPPASDDRGAGLPATGSARMPRPLLEPGATQQGQGKISGGRHSITITSDDDVRGK